MEVHPDKAHQGGERWSRLMEPLPLPLPLPYSCGGAMGDFKSICHVNHTQRQFHTDRFLLPEKIDSYRFRQGLIYWEWIDMNLG